MSYPFAFVPPMFMPPTTVGPMMPGPLPMIGPIVGAMPTAEQHEEFTLAFLKGQKQQIANMKEYLQECIKSIDASLAVIEREVAKIDAAKAERKQGASETRSKR